MNDKTITFDQSELHNYRRCTNNTHEVPYTFAIGRSIYDKYYSRKFRTLIGYSYVGILERHTDTYVHCTTRERAEKILKEGILKCHRADHLTVGKAVYTFPLGSGRVFPTGDFVAIVFTTDAEHVHLVDAEDSICVLGEADFLEDVPIRDAKILSLEEVNILSESVWNAQEALYKYYGIKEDEMKPEFANITREQLPNFITEFVINADFWVEPEENIKLKRIQSFD